MGSAKDGGIVMTKWEYKTIKIEGTMKSIFGGKLDFDPKFNEMGAQGWELVNIVGLNQGSSSTGIQAVFKREVA
jgi:hypothetical protein